VSRVAFILVVRGRVRCGEVAATDLYSHRFISSSRKHLSFHFIHFV
jgi:hypothetical protein